MKLLHPDWNHVFDFDEHDSFCLTIENPKILRNYLSELYGQSIGEEGNFVLSDKDKELSISDKLAVLVDLLFFPSSEKRVATKIQSRLKDFVVSEDLYTETTALLTDLERYAEQITEQFPYALQHKELDPPSLLKLLGFEIETEFDGPCEKLIEYFNISNDVCGVGIFVLVNPSAFFSPEELRLIIENCRLMKHNLISIESAVNGCTNLYDARAIIDVDGVEIF